MSKFVVGDIQGCYKGLQEVLKKADFNEANDKLFAVGDLVARGSDSLNTMHMLMDMGENFDSVLGNHDLHLIAIAFGIRLPKPQDNLQKLLSHQSFSRIIDWLLTKPLALKPAKKTLITHAGLYPQWSPKQARQHSKLVSKQLNGKNATKFLKNMYGNQPDFWHDELPPTEASRFIVNAMTRMRYVDPDLRLEFSTKCHPSVAPPSLRPWFAVANQSLQEKHRLVFGHWASLNGIVTRHPFSKAKVIGLDTGFVWGNKFSLLNLETEEIIEHSA